MAIVVSLFAFLFTLLGGLFALKLKRRMALVLGFSAGAVVGVALFDLVPEAIDLAGATAGPALVLACVGAGYAAYQLLQRGAARYAGAGGLGAAMLTIHSFLDGLSIGVAFKVSAAAGAIVAIAVVVHDLCDGINVVTVVRRNGGDPRRARRWLLIDAVAPVLGAACASGLSLHDEPLGLALAVFGGFFLYIGATDLLPASARAEAGWAPTLMTVLGMGVLYAAVRLASL
jgi:ZIP family zinc transporter